MYFLCFAIFVLKVYLSRGDNITHNDVTDISVHDVAEALLSVLQVNDNDTNRILDLRDKLSQIDSYVVDKDKYAELLHNKTKYIQLNETNFYTALQENDHFLIRNLNDSKNQYLKLKEKMNRDDLLKILASRGKSRVMKSARRMVDENFVAKKRREMALNEAVDKYLGEVPTDHHKYNESDRYNKVWDPQPELEERRAYHHPDGRRLFKGDRTTVRYYPFMVSIHIMGRFWCGGSIYHSDLIITSASCLQLMHNNRFFRENPRVLTVRVGSNHSRIGGEMIDALEVYFHPSYNPRTLNDNIAVIRLQRRLKMSYHRVPKIIEISKYGGGISSTSEVLLLGWGVTKTSQKMSYEPIYLQRKMLPVYPNKFCKEVYGEKFITRTMFCAGTLSTGEGACDHDAGGPAIMNGLLVGIISFGPTICGFPDAPTVFTLVGAYTDWIETINETMKEYHRGRQRTTTTTVDPFVDFFHTSSIQPKDVIMMPANVFDAFSKQNVKRARDDDEPGASPITRTYAQSDSQEFKVTPRIREEGKKGKNLYKKH